MKTLSRLTIAAIAAGTLGAQPFRATITGGEGDRGKCTIEVVVDGAVEIEVRGENAVMRNLEGRPPQWRRFVCNAPMPASPVDFRFAGVDGRGRQSLINDPRNGGPVVVRIEDPQSGSEGYTFDLFWRIGGYAPAPTPPLAPAPPPPGRFDQGRPDHDDDRYWRDRNEWSRGDWRARFFDRVRDDVDHVERYAFPGNGDRYRLDRTRQELTELQRAWEDRRINYRDLDDVIDALGRVVRDNRLSPRDRDVLEDDVNRLREFRDHR
jgi:hypothetical protein